MSKGIDDPILSALQTYERSPDRNEKKAVLLTPQGGYFLYGNRFCSIQKYDLELWSDTVQLQGDAVNSPIFLTCAQGGFSMAGTQRCSPQLVSLIFHIDLGEEDGLLRGILLVKGRDVRFSLFCDAAIEELYRLAREKEVQSSHRIPPDEELRQYAENLRRKDLHGLTGLYLRGKPVRSLLEEVKTCC